MQNQFVGKLVADARGNIIHPLACIGPDVAIGTDNYIGPYCLITGNVKIANGNRFEGFCSIGTPPEHREYWNKEHGGVVIGSNCVIREYVTINAGTAENTLVEDVVTILRGAHIGHDAWIHKGATISCNVLVGGHVDVDEYANLGLGCIIHQCQDIAVGCMIGMGAVVTKGLKMKPYKTYVGNPARLLGDNTKHPHYTVYMQQFPGEHE